MRKLVLYSLTAAIAVGLTACGGGGHSAPPAPPKLEDKFGTAFGRDFRAAPNSTPAPVKSGDVIPTDPAAPPTPLR